MKHLFYNISHWKIVWIISLLLLCFHAPSNAADITLQWEANLEPDLSGYMVCYKIGSPGEPYDNVHVVPVEDLNNPNNPEYTLTGLDPDTYYFMAVTAYDSKGLISDYSGEVNTAPPLYFPHIMSKDGWETEICIINTSDSQVLNGTCKAYNNAGVLVSEIDDVVLAPHGRRAIAVGDEFIDPADIGYIVFYIVFESKSDAVVGYTKFYVEGQYRVAFPAVSEINTGNIYVSHIASDSNWWTVVSLVNTTAATRELTITFNNGQSVPYTLNANEHKAFTIANLFNNQPQPDIKSAVITNAAGVIGLQLFCSDNQLSGILLKDDTTTRIYYLHVASDAMWWTGIVAYNSSASVSAIKITPYNTGGTALAPQFLPIGGQGKYVGVVADLNLPVDTAWLQMDAKSPITGFELFGTRDGNQLGGYGCVGISGKEGVFAKLEKNGWSGIAFVNTEDSAATVTLTAYDNDGNAIATETVGLPGHAKMVDITQNLFSLTQDISNATYITYSSDMDIVGFQLNGSSDNMMLDALPGL